MIKLNSKELRSSSPNEAQLAQLQKTKNEIYIILDNVLDTYNVGAIYRLADAVNARKVYLCGATETPPNSRIKKASINTTEWVSWQHFADAKTAIEDLRSKIEDITVIGVEQHKNSAPYDQVDYTFPIALVVGHETLGISKEVLEMCDTIVELPMFGINTSLNVMVSLGIVLYEVIEKNNPTIKPS